MTSQSSRQEATHKTDSAAPGCCLPKTTARTLATQASKPFHWRVRQDAKKPLNLSHEYLNVWHERDDFNGNQFEFMTGTFIGSNSGNDKRNFRGRGRSGNS